MYQSCCSNLVPSIASLLNKPLYVYFSDLKTEQTELQYLPSSAKDEVEDLSSLLSSVVSRHPSAVAVCVGAIFSTYQRTRVESVCQRLGLQVYAPLWRTPQAEVLEMIAERGIGEGGERKRLS